MSVINRRWQSRNRSPSPRPALLASQTRFSQVRRRTMRGAQSALLRTVPTPPPGKSLRKAKPRRRSPRNVRNSDVAAVRSSVFPESNAAHWRRLSGITSGGAGCYPLRQAAKPIQRRRGQPWTDAIQMSGRRAAAPPESQPAPTDGNSGFVANDISIRESILNVRRLFGTHGELRLPLTEQLDGNVRRPEGNLDPRKCSLAGAYEPSPSTKRSKICYHLYNPELVRRMEATFADRASSKPGDHRASWFLHARWRARSMSGTGATARRG